MNDFCKPWTVARESPISRFTVRRQSEIIKFKKFFTKQERMHDKKVFKIFQANLPLFKGNVLYFLSVVVAESLVL